MAAVVTVIVLLVSYVALKLAFDCLSAALWRRKIARLERLDRMDNGNRLVNYVVEMDAARHAIIAKWGGEFPRGTDGKIVRELAWKCLYCIQEKPSLLKALPKA